MKLKQILEEKVIDLLTKNEKEIQEQIRKDFRHGGVSYNKSNLKLECPAKEKALNFYEKTRPYSNLYFVYSVLRIIKDKDQQYYKELYSNIQKNKGEAEIDVNKIINLDPSVLGVYLVAQSLVEAVSHPDFKVKVTNQ